MRPRFHLALFALALPLAAGPVSPPVDSEVLEYVRQIRVQRGRVNYEVDVTISASIPALSKKGVLRATKRQASEGSASYQGLVFQGDGLVKTNVIARYLTAEVEHQKPEEKLATEISPLNYKFTPKGRARLGEREALVYEVKPLRRRPGLFRGKVYLDKETLLPLMEEGKLDKLPSIWLKEITFTRMYDLVGGFSMPARIHSEVNTRIVGKSTITVEFSNYRIHSPSLLAGGAASVVTSEYNLQQ